VFSLAADTGWSEETIMFMPMARVIQYQHCMLRRNSTRTRWSSSFPGDTGSETVISLGDRIAEIKAQWEHGRLTAEDDV